MTSTADPGPRGVAREQAARAAELIAQAGLEQRIRADTAAAGHTRTGGVGGHPFDPNYLAEAGTLLTEALSVRATSDEEAGENRRLLVNLGAIQLAQGRLIEARATLAPLRVPALMDIVDRELGVPRRRRTASPGRSHGLLAFTVAGIPVQVHETFLIVMVMLSYTAAASVEAIVTFAALVAGSVLLHELGHAFTLRGYGIPARIDLQGMGGFTSRLDDRPLSPGRSIIVSFAGIAVNLVLAGATFALTRSLLPVPSSGMARVVLLSLVEINLALAIFNVVPLLPLDGGRALAALAYRLFGARGVTAALCIALVLIALLAMVSLARSSYWTLVVLFWCAQTNVQLFRLGPAAVQALGFESPAATV